MAIAYIVHCDAESHVIDNELFTILPENRREQALSYRRYADRLRCYAAGLAAIAAASRLCGCKPEGVRLFTGNWKAPFALDDTGRKIFLSISHSSSQVVCIADWEACGADVETIRELPDAPGLAERFLHPAEAEKITASESSERVFAEYWTMKEAYVKYLGTGLSRHLASFYCECAEGQWTVNDPENENSGTLLCSGFSENGCRFSFVTKSAVTEIIRLALPELEKIFTEG